MLHKITIQYRYTAFSMVLARGDFDIAHSDDGVEIWVTQMGPYMNMNVAFIDRENGYVILVDPFDARRWIQSLSEESLVPTHIILTHTHRDHTYGVKKIREKVPDVEVWGHEESVSPSLLGRIIFRRMDFTDVWTHGPDEVEGWEVGNIKLKVTHSPGHAPGHVTFHGHGVYIAGDLLFTMRSGRVDLPGSDPQAQWRSLRFARDLLKTLPGDWRLIPGHRYDWIDGTTPDWVSISQALEHNLSLNAPDIDAFDALPYNRFDDELAG